MHPFRKAVESRDLAAMTALFAENAEFYSPVAFHPFVGREAVAGVLGAVMETFTEFAYTDELSGDDGVHVLVFEAAVGDKRMQGVDILHCDGDGLIRRLTVMLRPASGLMAMGEAMAPKVAGLAKGDAPSRTSQAR